MKPTPGAPHLEWALYYASLGLKVFPCWPTIAMGSHRICTCPKGAGCGATAGKHPLLPKRDEDDTYLTRATDDPEQIRLWWTKNPAANIAMAIAQSGKLVVDQDVRNGKTGPTTFEEAVWIFGDKIRTTPAQRTGSGGFQHIYDGTGLPADFTNPPELAKGGIDIKRNGHVVLPPSFNDSGQYEWLEGASLADLKPQSHAVLAPLLKEGAITRLCIGPVTNRDDETYRFCRNVKLYGKKRKLTEASLTQRVIDAARWRHGARGMGDMKPGDPFTLKDAEAKAAYALEQDDREEKTEGGAKKSTTEELVERITESVELFLDHNGDSWARFESGGHYETHRLNVRQFKRYLINQYHCGEKALTGVLDVLDARASANGKVYEVFLRTAWHEGTFYIDRGGPEWDAIRVNADGWSLVPSSECPVRFYRSQHTGELPHPERGGDIDELRKLFQVEGTDWTLLLGYLVGAFGTCGGNNVALPHLQIVGGQGIGKSVKSKIIKFLTDPDASPDWLSDERTGTSLKEVTDLASAALTNRLLVFGNLSYISEQISDLLCMLSTGGFITRRELYVTFGETGFRARRSVILTAITDISIAGDLIDRMVIVRPEPVQEAAEDQDLSETVWKARPRILGALLDAVAYGIGHPAKLTGTRPRLVDFAKFTASCLPCCGITSDEFLAAYNTNRDEGRQVSLEASPLYEHIKALLVGAPRGWTGTRDALRQYIEKADALYASRSLKNATAMGNALRRIATNLKAVGIEVIGLDPKDSKREGHGNVRTITIRRTTTVEAPKERPTRGNENVTPDDRDLRLEVTAMESAADPEM